MQTNLQRLKYKDEQAKILFCLQSEIIYQPNGLVGECLPWYCWVGGLIPGQVTLKTVTQYLGLEVEV